MGRIIRTAIMVAALGALLGASLSMAANRSSGQGANAQRQGPPRGLPAPNRVFDRTYESSVASKLGVTVTQLRNATKATRRALGRPARPAPGSEPPTQAQMEQLRLQRCNAETDGIAQRLGKSAADVRAAFKSAALEAVDRARSRNRITQAQADRLKQRINSSSCFLPPPPHRHGPRGPRGDGPPPGAGGQ
jgi:hypothetical protein